MPELDPNLKELEDRLDALVRTQIDFQKEISLIRGEIVRLRARKMTDEHERSSTSFYTPERTPPVKQGTESPVGETPRPATRPVPPSTERPRQPIPAGSSPPTPRSTRPPVRAQSAGDSGYELPKRTPYVSEPVLSSSTVTSDAFSRFVSQHTENARANLEKFIGENLISLIGIVVLILGVGIGAKYAIDNNLISPLTRIIIGYVFGFGLVALAIKFKKSYLNFSAVLISGGMAIMYFVTYFAYSAYGLISQLGAFGLMVMFTAATVAAALIYSRQVIAHIGLVGAYAVPFLLSSDSGNYLALFSYMAVLNTGILAVSLKKQWKPIFYTSSAFTWVIFYGWFATKYAAAEHFGLALTFLGVFFAILYATKIVQTRLLTSDDDKTENLIASTLTVAIFYAICFAIGTSSPLDAVRSSTFLAYVAVASIMIVGVSLWFHKHLVPFYTASVFKWAIFCGWFVTTYTYQEHFALALVFLGIFFAISYTTTLVRTRFIESENDRAGNLVASVLTGAVFYLFCFAMITDPAAEFAHYWTLFSYLAVASSLILATSLKFFGRALMYLVVPFTWAIYGGWFFNRYDPTQHFELATVFALLFFAIFYFSILFNRLVEESFTLVEHTSLVLSNSFVFYGFGYWLLDGNAALRDYLGLYTVGNAILHLVVALAVRGLKPKAIDVVQVLTVLVLTFASIAVPVQFDGNLVTMIWAVEGAILFWFGRTRAVPLFEKYSYPVMLLAIGSLALEWIMIYGDRISGPPNPVTPFANTDFVTAAVFVAAFAFIYFTNRDSRHEPAIGKDLVRPFGIAIATAGSIVLYNMFRMEIGNYFYLVAVNLGVKLEPIVGGPGVGATGNLGLFSTAWQINYTLFFLTAMAVVNLKKFRSTSLAFVNSGLALLAMAAFATVSMFVFHELRTVFMSGNFNPDFVSHWMYIAIRPISYALAAALLYVLYEYTRDPLLESRVEPSVLSYGFDGIAYSLVFIVASCELINLMRQFGIPDATKLGLSILWGVYALVLIAIGIAKDKKHLRITAFVLLAVTLVKLFFYDIADLDTIPKTILFVTLGITLLVVSFLYNKYKDVIFKVEPASEE